ncbi:hypothetical protein BV25DRAFT_1914132 [Artomyces pyxidatus]|uniref:Uncharacterized protein n=1 Tax=Artomyces pyxidatus TaxID=48021 RepID=A0ACB8T899_9AGAM|nr:hypothetical protein BV25DRAFT_1914132 [Artomyces pyxidatus]
MATSDDSGERQSASLESMYMMGTILAGVSYGVVLCLALLATSYLSKASWRTALLVFWLFSLATTCIGLQIRWTLLGFIMNHTYPGGPNAFMEEDVGNWINVFLNATLVFMSWTADAILLYRFSVIYSSFRLYTIPPIIVYIATIATGSVSLQKLTVPGTTQSTNALATWSIAYRTTSLCLSVSLTMLIVGRILYYRHQLRFYGTSSRSFSNLLSIVNMLVESASLETAAALVYIICEGINSPLRNVFLPVLGQMQIISPLLIVCRVARGRAWSKNTMESMTQSLLPTLAVRPSLQINTDYASSVSDTFTTPLKSPGGLFSNINYSPTYSWCEGNGDGIIPPTPSIDEMRISPLPRAEQKRMTW